MIPKIIHYCWFGRNPLPLLAVKCIESWKRYFPDYEIREWNEDNFNVNMIPYTREAYEAKKYAFVSDYARFYILYYYGGLYFDTDVEVIKPMNDIIERGAFMGCENELKLGGTSILAVAPGLGLGCIPRLGFYEDMLNLYAGLHFQYAGNDLNQKTVVEYTTELLVAKGLRNIDDIQCVNEIWIYPKEYFCPIDYRTNKMNVTCNTRSIHHFAASWKSWDEKMKIIIARIIGTKLTHILGNARRCIIGKK